MLTGSIGIGAPLGVMPGGLPGGIPAVGGPAGSALMPMLGPAVGATGMTSLRMGALASLLGEFGTAKLLLTLLILDATAPDRHERCHGSSALALLVGYALAAQLGQALEGLTGDSTSGPGSLAPAGLFLDASA